MHIVAWSQKQKPELKYVIDIPKPQKGAHGRGHFFLAVKMYAILVSFLRKDFEPQVLSNHFRRLKRMDEMHDKTAMSKVSFRLVLILGVFFYFWGLISKFSFVALD